jgi:hypothetical protein
MKVYEVVPVPLRPDVRDGAAFRLLDTELYRRFTFLEASLQGFPDSVAVGAPDGSPDRFPDVLFADVPWPLWSTKLLDALNAVGPFVHTRFAVRFAGVSQQASQEAETHVFVHFPPKVGVLNRTLSKFDTSSFMPDMITQMKSPVLKVGPSDSGVLRCDEWPSVLVFGEAAEILRYGPFTGYDLIDWSGVSPVRIQRSLERP